MGKISWKVYLYAGLAVLILSIPLIVLLRPVLEDESGHYDMLLFLLPIDVGIVLLVFATAKKRMESGAVIADRIRRALTSSQKCLLIALPMFLLGGILNQHTDGQYGVFLLIGSSLLTYTSVFLALRRHQYKSNKPKQFLRPSDQTINTKASVQPSPPPVANRTDVSEAARVTALPSPPPVNSQTNTSGGTQTASAPSPTVTCSKCGKRIYLPSPKLLIRNRYYCPECIIAEKKGNSGRCSVCGTQLSRQKVYIVSDAYYCRECFASRFPHNAENPAASSEAPDPDFFDRDLFNRECKSFMKPHLPTDIGQIDGQKRLLNAIFRVFPGTRDFFADETDLSSIEQIAERLDKALAKSESDTVASAETDSLINVYFLLDYAAYNATPVSEAISRAGARIGIELRKRFRNEPTSAEQH